MALPEGWRRIRKGEAGYSASARTYYDSEGRIRSRRAADNERIRSAGWRNKYDFDSRFRPRSGHRGYARWAQAGVENDKVSGADLRKSDSEFNRLFLDARASDFEQSPTGAFATFLVFIGYREPEWEFDIGDTPEAS